METRALLESLLSRLRRLYAANNRVFNQPPGAPEQALRDYESRLGFTFDESLRELWKLANGSGGAPWLMDEGSPYNFLSLEEAFEERFTRDYKWFEIWSGDPPEGDRQGFVQPDYMEHSRWLLVGRFPGGSDKLYFDAAPTEAGQYGQIIQYSHDPEAIDYLAPSIAALLAQHVEEREAMAKDDLEQ